MAKIKNMAELRDHQLEALELLKAGDIDIKEAQTIAKLASSIITGIRVQQEYAYAVGHKPKIPFNGDCLGAKITKP